MDGFESRIRPMQLQGTIDFQNEVNLLKKVLNKSTQVFNKSTSVLNMSMLVPSEETSNKNVFISLEEIRDIELWV